MTSAQNIRIRFAPSPTGHMHVGHLRATLPNILFALKARQQGQGATLILRFEDSDFQRNKIESEPAFLADLAWLGFTFDEGPHLDNSTAYGPYRTIERADRGDYTAAVEKLIASGRAYECFTSPEELDLLRKVQTSRNEPPRYDNRHRNLSDDDKARYRAEGRQPVIRFRLSEEDIVFHDLIRGEQRFKPENLGGDPVIVRSNGLPLFTFYGCVDDIAMAITHVIRGEDHITNAAVQVQMYQALGAKPPQFAHIPLMLDKDGHKMSKRLGGLQVGQLRERGFLPAAILGYMSSLGLSEQPKPNATLEDLAAGFDFSRINKAPVRFDEDQLAHSNATALHHADWYNVRSFALPFIPAGSKIAGDDLAQATLWPLVREGLATLADIPAVLEPILNVPQQVDLNPEERALIATALEYLPQEFQTDTWQTLITQLKQLTGRNGKNLFMPLRRALTGQEHGPDLAQLLPVWGPAEVRARLERCC